MKKIFLLVTVFTTFNLLADILIEPQLGYVISNKFAGTTNLVSGLNTGTSTNDYKATGLSYGGRFGYQIFGFMGGLTYQKFSGTSVDYTNNGNKVDYKLTNMGIFAGYTAPILLRAWFAYNLSSKLPVNNGTFKGYSTEFGVGYTGIPFLSFNFIYRMYTFISETTSTTEWVVTNFKPKEMEIAISIPLNL